jgi:hypothetical protein
VHTQLLLLLLPILVGGGGGRWPPKPAGHGQVRPPTRGERPKDCGGGWGKDKANQ